ncbi:MAG: nitroreductase family protein [Acidimicrobiales bacterium]|nr:nitroreductase family protein [Acidimicrobiales bacterium]
MFDLAETDRLLTTTRAVRRRLDLDRPVEREVILDCLRIATQAPTASNGQTWRWMVVTDADKRRALADLYREAGMGYLEVASQQEQDPQTARVYASALELAEQLERVPVHVIPCVEGRVDGVPLGLAAAVFGSIIPAAWSFQLALRSRGLGSVWTTLHLFEERRAAELLGIPDSVTQVALIPVAYTLGDDFRPATRGPVEEITSWDTWGARP